MEITYQTFFPQQRLDLLAGSFKIFAEKNPSIKANVVFDADHRAKLATQMAADSAPDTFIHDVWSAAKYYEAGGILDLTSRFAVDKIDLARDYSLIGIEQWCGKSYAVPFYVTSMLLAYNKDLLSLVRLTHGKSGMGSGRGTTSFLSPSRSPRHRVPTVPRDRGGWSWTATASTTSTATCRYG